MSISVNDRNNIVNSITISSVSPMTTEPVQVSLAELAKQIQDAMASGDLQRFQTLFQDPRARSDDVFQKIDGSALQFLRWQELVIPSPNSTSFLERFREAVAQRNTTTRFTDFLSEIELEDFEPLLAYCQIPQPLTATDSLNSLRAQIECIRRIKQFARTEPYQENQFSTFVRSLLTTMPLHDLLQCCEVTMRRSSFFERPVEQITRAIHIFPQVQSLITNNNINDIIENQNIDEIAVLCCRTGSSQPSAELQCAMCCAALRNLENTLSSPSLSATQRTMTTKKKNEVMLRLFTINKANSKLFSTYMDNISRATPNADAAVIDSIKSALQFFLLVDSGNWATLLQRRQSSPAEFERYCTKYHAIFQLEVSAQDTIDLLQAIKSIPQSLFEQTYSYFTNITSQNVTPTEALRVAICITTHLMPPYNWSRFHNALVEENFSDNAIASLITFMQNMPLSDSTISEQRTHILEHYQQIQQNIQQNYRGIAMEALSTVIITAYELPKISNVYQTVLSSQGETTIQVHEQSISMIREGDKLYIPSRKLAGGLKKVFRTVQFAIPSNSSSLSLTAPQRGPVALTQRIGTDLLERNIYYGQRLNGAPHVVTTISVQVLTSPQQGARGYFFLESCDQDLAHAIPEGVSCTVVIEKLKLFKQALLGVQSMHERGFVHRDIKANNFLAHATEQRIDIRITDFDLTAEAQDVTQTNSQTCGPIKPRIMSPAFPFATDIYQCGALLAHIYDSNSALYAALRTSGYSNAFTRPRLPHETEDTDLRIYAPEAQLARAQQAIESGSTTAEQRAELEVYTLISRLCALEPAQRPTIGEAISLTSAAIARLEQIQTA